MQDIFAEGDTVRSIVKLLSHEQSKERDEAVSLLYELSKTEALCEKIGAINGAILMLVGMTSSNSENILTVEKADKTLENLGKCENNVRQMAENGRLQPLLTQILEGTFTALRSLSLELIFAELFFFFFPFDRTADICRTCAADTINS